MPRTQAEYQTQALIPDGMCVKLYEGGDSLHSAKIVSSVGMFNLLDSGRRLVYSGIDPALVEQLVILFGLDEL